MKRNPARWQQTLALLTTMAACVAITLAYSGDGVPALGAQIALADEPEKPAAPKEIPPELKQIADNAYLEIDGVLQILRYERPWKESELRDVIELAKGFDKVKLAGRFDGASLAVLQQMQGLVELNVGQSPEFRTKDIEALSNLRGLRELNLIGPKVTRAALPRVGRLSQLEELYLWHATDLQDDDLAPLANLDNLEVFQVHHSRLRDLALTHLTKLDRLRHLRFRDSRVTYEGLLQLRSLKSLKKVHTSPAWLFADQLDKMRDAWPDLQEPNGEAFLWDIEAKTLKAIVGFSSESSVPTFSHDGSLAAQSLSGRLYLLDGNKGTVLRQLSDPEFRRPTHDQIAFSRDGKRVVAREAATPRELGESLKVWEVATGKLLFQRGTSDEGFDTKWPPAILTLSADGRFLAAGRYSPSVRVWNIANKTLKAEIPTPALKQLAFLSDGKRLIGTTGWGLQIWDLDTGQETVKIPGLFQFVLSKDETTVITHDGEEAVHVYRLADGRLLKSYRGDWQLRGWSILSPDGRYLVTSNEGVLSIWNVATGKLDHQVKPIDCRAFGHLAKRQFTPDGKSLIIDSYMLSGPD